MRDSDLIIGSVGDSPAYLIRDTRPRKLTLDHITQTPSHDAETPPANGENAKPKLVRALGVAPSVKVDIITGRVRDGDVVVLCSDGLTRYVTPEEIERTVSELPVIDAARVLIETANERGGADNVSVIVLRLADESLAQLPALDDPMMGWGRSRRGGERPRAPQETVSVRAKKPPALRNLSIILCATCGGCCAAIPF